MNEVETHYATQPHRAGTQAGDAQASSRPADVARAALDQAAASARQASETLKDGVSSVRRTAEDAYDRASNVAADYYDSASRNAVYARRRSVAEFNRTKRQVEGYVDANPAVIGVAGVAIGLLVGALLPNTRRENQLFGRYADEVKDQGYRYAKEFAEQGKHLVDDSLKAARAGQEPSRHA